MLLCTRALLRACCGRARGSRRGAERGSSGARPTNASAAGTRRCAPCRARCGTRMQRSRSTWRCCRSRPRRPPAEVGACSCAPPWPVPRGLHALCSAQTGRHAGTVAMRFGCHLACRACMHRSAAPNRCADAGGEHCQLVAACCRRSPPRSARAQRSGWSLLTGAGRSAPARPRGTPERAAQRLAKTRCSRTR